MRDFTLKAYKQYLLALKSNLGVFLRFDQLIGAENIPDKFCLIRHDVDRKPEFALAMAKLEHHLGIIATYYFRIKKCSFDPEIIKQIEQLGHEIGYHYEDLSDSKGDTKKALAKFEENLGVFRAIANINTCSMHGRPLLPYDNRDLWRIKKNHQSLKGKLNLLGEVYLDIDYSDIAYINDTGRNWTSGKSNRRDKVLSNINADFESGKALLTYFKTTPHPKICFQVHPERWTNNLFGWVAQYSKDTAINLVKFVLSFIKP